MIKRINLIEKQSFTITYMRLLQVVLCVAGCIVVLASWQTYKAKTFDPLLQRARAQIESLKEEKKSLEKKPTIKKQEKVQVGEYQDLFDVLNAYPKWASVVEQVTLSLPNSVWLTGMTTIVTQKAPPAPVKADKKEASKETAKDAGNAKPAGLLGPESIKLTITGLSADVDGLSSFVKNLQSSEFFSKTTVQDSHKESFGFEFKIESYLKLESNEQ